MSLYYYTYIYNNNMYKFILLLGIAIVIYFLYREIRLLKNKYEIINTTLENIKSQININQQCNLCNDNLNKNNLNKYNLNKYNLNDTLNKHNINTNIYAYVNKYNDNLNNDNLDNNNLDNNNLDDNNLDTDNLDNNNLDNNNLDNYNLNNNNLDTDILDDDILDNDILDNDNLDNDNLDNNNLDDDILDDNNLYDDNLDDDNLDNNIEIYSNEGTSDEHNIIKSLDIEQIEPNIKINQKIFSYESLNKLKLAKIKDIAKENLILLNQGTKVKNKQELINDILEKNI